MSDKCQTNVSIDKYRVVENSIEESSRDKGEVDISDIIQVYENEIGMMTLSIAEDINFYLEELNKELIIVTIQEASKNNARTWNYIKAILENMKKENIKTVADFKNRKKPNKNKPENKPNKNKNYKPGKYDDLYE